MVYRPRRSRGLGFARDNAFHVFPRQLGLGRCSICFSQRRKARKGNSKAKSRQSRSLAPSQRSTKWKFPDAKASQKATARMFAGEFSGPRQVSWSIDPGAAGAWTLRKKRFWRLPPPTLEELPILPSK